MKSFISRLVLLSQLSPLAVLGPLALPAGTLLAAAQDRPGELNEASPAAGGLEQFQNRFVKVRLPPQYSPDKKYPLLILLHGFTSEPQSQDAYLNLSSQATQRGFIFVAPSGTPTPSALQQYPNGPSSKHQLFWNATEACCNFEKVPNLDDVAFLRALIEASKAQYAVDPSRIYVFGHSNGGFMAHRLACDAADAVTAIASLAGSLRPDPNLCQASRPVAVLNIHGLKDETVLYAGGQFNEADPLSRYPGAQATIEHWAKINGCRQLSDPSGTELSLKLLQGSAQADTAVIDFKECKDGVATTLLRIPEGWHAPGISEGSQAFGPAFIPYVLDFFSAQKRP